MSKPHPFAHLTPLEQAGLALEAVRLFHNWKLPGTMRGEVERACEVVKDELNRAPKAKPKTDFLLITTEHNGE